ncbi:tRNA (5-methylaminomethyl-2-thiouridine)(34)-methyltransferase MnmD [Confluentibacter sediminis]|uniref:tRNA (5-methylaminomethyl-2-thiouridine)(34)-methyltransferase MnmD n=1 Tax=Confluentibacter sediminis TaxID=2219045 RepID=UPI000DAE47D6|nr:tRNA (5-methylaminomethyl-2-thiouridine)(34)-methyltransferase MnmD [Confluentibacter sediminis]
MERKVIITADGSSTIHLPEWDEHYHSKHGAIQEAYHVFITHGLQYFCHSKDLNTSPKEVAILEIGFGTGLNALITLIEAEKLNTSIHYVGVEGYPVSAEEISQLNYTNTLNVENGASIFKQMHDIPWEAHHELIPHFSLKKKQLLFSEIKEQNSYDIIYFDAFGARVQPELWTEAIFEKMFNALKENGVLVTYAAKGSVRRAMLAVGFKVEKLPGPPGKREMLRATKKL